MNNSDRNSEEICLETLPDEVLLPVLSYLNIVDIVQAFHQLNQRFNSLIYESAQRIRLPSGTPSAWIDQYMPQLESQIKTICLNEQSSKHVFDKTWTFPNLHLIKLEGNDWNMSLELENQSASVAVMSCLNLLHQAGFSTNIFPANILINNEIDYTKIPVCSFVRSLSIKTCSARGLFILITCASNLIHLKINTLTLGRESSGYLDNFRRQNRTIHLISLNITDSIMENFDFMEHLINSCKTSIKKLTLGVWCYRPIDGHRLETIFKACEQLEKLAFFFNYDCKEYGHISECQHSFQSEWWLDTRRPPVYIQHHNNNYIMASMPCLRSFNFENDLYDWCFNKGDQNSSFVRFKNINNIHFINDIHQSISLEYLYFVDRVFPSSNQTLCFDFCDLQLVDVLSYMLMEDPSMTPALPNVTHFIVGSSRKLDSLMLCVWILLTPNLQVLDISNLTTFNKTELAKELGDMIDDDQRLKPSFEHINKLFIFKKYTDIDTKTNIELFFAFQKVFIKAIIELS